MSYRSTEEWVEIRKGGDYVSLGERFAVSPVIARLLRNRGADSDDEIRNFLYGTLQDLEDPRLLNGSVEAVRLLHGKIITGKRIRIIGDYDVDGICATFILYDTLTRAAKAHAGRVTASDRADEDRTHEDCTDDISSCSLIDYDVPDRIRDGFGLNVRLIDDAYQSGVDTVITCDNGIAAVEAIKRAKDLGMTVIITDHHEPDKDLPKADIIVDTKMPQDLYPNKELCGAATVWKLMYLYESIYLLHPDEDEQNSIPLPPVNECPVTMEHLPFAAIATVADVMKLMGENRILVKNGLSMIQHCSNTGLQALLSQTQLTGKALNCYDIGFILGPCLNAGGRLDSAKRCIELLKEKEPAEAVSMAAQLCSLNAERKEMTEQGRKDADSQIEGSSALPGILVIYLPGIHESVAGIIASRIKDTYNRPSFVLTDSDDPDILKGSGRSIEAYNMFNGLAEIRDVFTKFGGHAMAAGVSLRRDRLEEFKSRINENCMLTETDLVRKVRIDMRLPLSYVTEDFIESLHILEPFGTGNPSPLFAQSNLKVLQMRVLGQKRNAVRLLLEDEGTRMDAVWFGSADDMEDYIRTVSGEDTLARLRLGMENRLRLAVTYHPEINEFRGVRNVQIRIVNYR